MVNKNNYVVDTNIEGRATEKVSVRVDKKANKKSGSSTTGNAANSA